jgi:hypothetical protein
MEVWSFISKLLKDLSGNRIFEDNTRGSITSLEKLMFLKV